MIVLRFRDLLEIAMVEFGFPSHDDFQVCDHSIVFGCVFSFDLTHY